MSSICLKDYCTSYKNFSLKNINLTINKGETFAILGKTGSGKSTLLNGILGLHKDFTGEILLNEKEISKIPMKNRNMGIVYQDYRLFPCMNVFENIVYSMTLRKYSKKEKEERGSYLMDLFGIKNIREQSIKTISGGESQRTALARALCIQPDILLLDEPFSALDPVTKKLMYREFELIQKNFNCTIIFVTHDFKEAEFLADRIGILLNGELKTVVSSNQLFTTEYNNSDIDLFLGKDVL